MPQQFAPPLRSSESDKVAGERWGSLKQDIRNRYSANHPCGFVLIVLVTNSLCWLTVLNPHLHQEEYVEKVAHIKAATER